MTTYMIPPSALGLALSLDSAESDVNNLERYDTGNVTALIEAAYVQVSGFTGYASTWRFLLPLITETTLLGKMYCIRTSLLLSTYRLM